MLSELRSLALDYAYQELGNGKPPDNLEYWFKDLHEHQTKDLFPYLVEPDMNVPLVYLLRPDDVDPELAILGVQEHKPGAEINYPFIKVSGNDPYLGVSFKRTNGQNGVPTPQPAKVQLSMKGWQVVRDAGESYSPLFDQFLQLAGRTKIRREGDAEVHTVPKGQYRTIIDYAAKFLIPNGKSVFMTLTDASGNFPGTLVDYRRFIMDNEAPTRYEVNDVPAHPDGSCCLCGTDHVTVYAQGVKGAGFNIMNQHRAGAFTNSDKGSAWKKFAICLCCCRLLTIAKLQVVPALQVKIAGTSAAVIPAMSQDYHQRQSLMRQMRDDYGKLIHSNPEKEAGGVTQIEQGLLENLTENQKALASVTILWGTFGQDIGDVKAVVREVLPSRLSKLSDLNAEVETWVHPVFPDAEHNDYKLRITLGMGCLTRYFSKVADKSNDKNHPDNSLRMFNFKRQLLEAIFSGRPLLDVRGLEEEIHATIRQHFSLNYQEGSHFYSDFWVQGNKPAGPKTPFTTIAGWVKHVARLLHYLRKVGVLTMNEPYIPTVPELQNFVGPESGIDSPEKAYAYWLGVLHGHVLQYQRRNNRRQSAVNWLNQLELSSDKLPELFTKQYGQLVKFDQEGQPGKVLSWDHIKGLTEEISLLGVMLGDKIKLTRAQTNYFLVLGLGTSRNVWWMAPKTEDSKNNQPPIIEETQV